MDPASSCAIYVRRSAARRVGDDSEANARLGGNRSLLEQEEECRQLADRHGLGVVEVYREREGTGASQRSRKARPEWERALADLRTGNRFRTVIVWALDRADRRGADTLAHLLTEHAASGRRVLGVDGTDTGDEKSRLATIIRGEMAREESEKIAERVKRTKRHRRDAGMWLGGRAPYGLRVEGGRLAPDPERFEIARWIADSLIAGRTLWWVVGDLNKRGVPGPSGALWRVPTVAALVRSPAWAGLASVPRLTDSKNYTTADIYRKPDGSTVSVGMGVVSPEERALVLARLAERTDVRSQKRGGVAETVRVGRKPRRFVLGDVLRCDACGFPASLSGTADRPSVRCSNRGQGNGRCPGFTAPLGGVQEYVLRRIVSRLGALDPEDPVLWDVAARFAAETDQGGQTEKAAAEATLALADADVERLLGLAASGVITAGEAAQLLPAARSRRDVARRDLAAMVGPAPDISPLLDAVNVAEFWESLDDVDRWRAIVRATVTSIRVRRAPGRGVRFDPESRLIIGWFESGIEPDPSLPLMFRRGSRAATPK